MNVLAFDYGASSGRAVLGSFDGKRLAVSEVHRFPNDPVRVNASLYWDILRLYHELKQGILKCYAQGEAAIASLGVDTWGVDFGLLDADGNLLGNPYHYRDRRTEGMFEIAASRVPKAELYQSTGIAFQPFNTLYQLLAMAEARSPLLDPARTLCFIPDLLNYFLTGTRVSEYTIASTSQMLDAARRDWHRRLLERIGIPAGLLTEIIRPGTVVGEIKVDLAEELNIPRLPVIATASHDTASAVAAVPAAAGNFAYLSSGTWSLMGLESDRPLINERTMRWNYTNEGGLQNSYRVLKNIMGLWILQECKREWDRTGPVAGFEHLERLAEGAAPLKALIDPDHPSFFNPGKMPEKVREFCRATGQAPPESRGGIVRCVLESLALKYRMVLDELESIAGSPIPVIHIVGGGSRNRLLNQFTADATGKPVLAGPAEATAIGNILVQLIALGELSGVQEARALARASFPVVIYQPSEPEAWSESYERFKEMTRHG
jgi:rhamnulokinase